MRPSVLVMNDRFVNYVNNTRLIIRDALSDAKTSQIMHVVCIRMILAVSIRTVADVKLVQVNARTDLNRQMTQM